MRAFALPFFLLFFLFAIPQAIASTELGPIREPAELEGGGLLIRTSGGLRQAPTMSTDVAIEVVGLIAKYEKFYFPSAIDFGEEKALE